MNILGLILARGGSKGVPRKNIKLLNGKPLISYVINESKKVFEDVYVSTEDWEIKYVAENFGANVINRPPELATDTSKSIDVVKHALTVVEADVIVLLNCCTPLLKAQHIGEAVKLFLEKKADSVTSVVESFESHPSKLCELDDNNRIIPIGKFETGERQKQTKIYRRNTCMYIATRETIMSGSFFGKKNFAYVMGVEKSLDINSRWDFLLCEAIIKFKLHEKMQNT